MILYFLRHGKAEPQGGLGRKDADRILTADGREKVTRILILARDNLNVEIERILSSPYKRAIETSEIAKEILKPRKHKIVTGKELEPERSPFELYSFVSKQKFGPQDRVLLVSHQPILGNTISDLIGTDVEFVFAPASMARIDTGEEPRARSGKLIWLLSSDVIQ